MNATAERCRVGYDGLIAGRLLAAASRRDGCRRGSKVADKLPDATTPDRARLALKTAFLGSRLGKLARCYVCCDTDCLKGQGRFSAAGLMMIDVQQRS